MVKSPRAVYATQPVPLQNQIADLLAGAAARTLEGEICALIVPDTNLLSGSAAAASVYKVLHERQFDTVILIAPSHTEAFQRITICSIDTYHTPLGDLEVNDRMRNELCDEDDDIFLDDKGHYHTSGVDVQLPYLQAMLPAFDIVPIVMGEESPSFCHELGQAVGEVMYNRRTLVVACANIVAASEEALATFKTHFEGRDVHSLMALLNSEAVHMEGKGAVLVAMIAALRRDANHADVLYLQAPEDQSPGYVGAVLWRA